MTPRDIIKANIECRCDDRIGFNFDGGRRNDLAGAGVARPFQTKKWEEDGYEFSTDEWGNIWHRMVGMSQGGEVFRPAIADWSDLDRLELPDFDNTIDKRR